MLREVREVLGDPAKDYRMLGFVDDDNRKRDGRIQGYPALHRLDIRVEPVVAAC